MKNIELSPKDILFEDDVIIVVNKPAGLPSQATLDPNRDHCFAAVRRYLEKREKSPYVGLHHRLDALTSGALLMTKRESVNASISAQFQNHTIGKTYCAICVTDGDVDGAYLTPQNGWLIDAPIGEVPGGRVQKFSVTGKKRKPARTRVVCESAIPLRDGLVGVWQCSPETGRTHQIRVHLASLGLKIVGDPLYGCPLPRSLRVCDPGRMCLHAERIAFIHPLTNQEIEVIAPRPPEFTSFIKRAQKLHR
ncbi:MAG: RluA family pseudouridine synthase [Proteobacteria bacterium]|nr:RluA family pseudouridine synthase [Pseudomonadota bacterium]